MTRLLKIFGFFLLPAIIAGCAPYYYVPATQSIPLIDEKGDADLTISFTAVQVDASATYGVGHHLALKADGSWYDFSGDGEAGKDVLVRRFEIGAGYFTEIMDGYVFEIYGFVGPGDMKNILPHTIDDHPGTLGRVVANFDLMGIQPNFGYKSEIWTAGFSTRFVRLHYRQIEGSLIFEELDQVAYLKANKTHFLIEPAFTFKLGFENVKFQLQYMYSINASNSFFRQKNSNISVGVNFAL